MYASLYYQEYSNVSSMKITLTLTLVSVYLFIPSFSNCQSIFFILLIFNETTNNEIWCTVSSWVDPLRVQIIKAHHNWIVIAYAHFITCYRLKDSSGWQHVFTSPHIECIIERVAINAKMAGADGKMVAISYGSQVRLWGVLGSEEGISRLSKVGTFNLNVRVEYLFFIGSQLVALSPTGKIGVWHAMTHHWQIQDVVPILSFDTAGSFLLLGCNNGSIYYIGKRKIYCWIKFWIILWLANSTNNHLIITFQYMKI